MEALDRRRSAVHEAGHFVVARHLGVRVCGAYISRVRDPSLDEPSWTGRMSIERRAYVRSSRRRLCMVAVAGAVAEDVWFKGYTCPDDLLEFEGDLSLTDWALAGCVPGEPDRKMLRAAEEVADLLSREGGVLWQPLCLVARALLRVGIVEASGRLVESQVLGG
jgi:hypothetical protein